MPQARRRTRNSLPMSPPLGWEHINLTGEYRWTA